MFSLIVSNSGLLIHLWLISSDLRRSCTVRQIIPLEKISLADTLEWFLFCSDSDLGRNPTVHKKFLQALIQQFVTAVDEQYTVHKKFLQALRNLFPFGSHSDRTWAYNLNGDSFWVLPLAFLLPRTYFRWASCWNIPVGASELTPFVARSDCFCYLRSVEIPSQGFLLVFPRWGLP